MDKYFSECYLYNSDVFGIMTTYYIFFQVKLDDIHLDDDLKSIFLNRIRSSVSFKKSKFLLVG